MPQKPDIFSDPTAGEPIRSERGQADAFSDPYAGEPLRVNSRAQKIAADSAPTVGGMVGGMAGGVPGAIVGGAAGKGYGDLIAHGAEIPGALADVAHNMLSEPMATMQGAFNGIAQGAGDTAKAAGIEGVSQVAGNAVAKAGGVMAKWLMNRATTRVSAKLMQEFPDLSDTLIDEALTVSKGGYDKARGLLTVAKKKATAALRTADSAGSTVPVHMNPDVAESFKTALLEDAIKSRGLDPNAHGVVTTATNRLPQHLRTLFKEIDEAAERGWVMDVKPTQADLLKRRLQLESRPTYAQRGAPNGPRALGMDSAERAEFASQLNAAIDNVASGYKAANAEAQPLIGATRGIKQAIRPSGNLYQAMVRPAVGAALGAGAASQSEAPGGSALGAIAGAALTSPAGMSREAILLASPAMQGLLKQMPRATAAALTALLSQRSGGPAPAPGTPE